MVEGSAFVLATAAAINSGMSKIHEGRFKLRAELESPPALRQFGSGWTSGVLGLVLGLAGFSLVLALQHKSLLKHVIGIALFPSAVGLK